MFPFWQGNRCTYNSLHILIIPCRLLSYLMYFCSSYSNTGTGSSSNEPTQEEVTQVPSTPLPDS